ncbi:class I SAM-dependent methyltransferase [Flagellimonas lutaonensis]|uniref:Methyltransferase n=1 Tax=Flagellimonas lutaonensis TaxID=516051 RepID=A0A0D5YST7_9FLAO|nr:class I SAM-dependent methyltransferase [Allomuricauda lutaonensis]AKA34969.1 methyltransferase [Allomuricauda lutaonensis]
MRSYLKTKDFSVTGESFELLHDESLDMLVTHPQPQNSSAYYKSESYISHSDSRNNLIEKLYHWVKGYMLRRKMKLLGQWCGHERSLLDIGAGSGDFVLRAQKEGWSATGVEPSVYARERAHEKGVSLKADLNAVADRKFQTVTLWHVLEHLPDLEKQAAVISGLLADEGTLFIAVPNFRSYDARHYAEFWAAYDVPRHLWHFSQTSMAKLFEGRGLKVVKTRPMFFDAFYVSMLSEKYKKNPLWWFTFPWVGLWSNVKAAFSGEYSSLIYILKRK